MNETIEKLFSGSWRCFGFSVTWIFIYNLAVFNTWIPDSETIYVIESTFKYVIAFRRFRLEINLSKLF